MVTKQIQGEQVDTTYAGYCVGDCKDWTRGGVELDACGCKCPKCGKDTVMGAINAASAMLKERDLPLDAPKYPVVLCDSCGGHISRRPNGTLRGVALWNQPDGTLTCRDCAHTIIDECCGDA